MAHIPKKKMKLQNVLILVLIAFILINIGISQIIQRVQVGADNSPKTITGGPTVPENADIDEYSSCASKATEVTSDLPAGTSLTITSNNIEATKFEIKFRLDSNMAGTFKEFSIMDWSKSTIIKQLAPEAQNLNINNKNTFSRYINIPAGSTAKFVTSTDFCWLANNAKYYKVSNVMSNTVKFTNPAVAPGEGPKPPVIDDEEGVPVDSRASDSTTTTATGDNAICLNQCKPSGFHWPWDLSGAMQNAICEMQCTFINWTTNAISFFVRDMLIPSLGI